MSNTQGGGIEYPIFLSNKPNGEDKFEGGSQNKTANVIVELIKSDYYKTKVIGLEGNWGAGKSNVVEIIKSKLSGDYITFIFDAWGNQEDLTRKSFLEQLINELISAKCISSIEKLNSIKNELLAKKTTKHKETFPIIKSYWLFITSAVLSFGFLLNIYHNIFEKFDFIKSIDFGIWKPIIIIYLLPFLLFSWGIYLIVEEYKIIKTKKEFSNKKFGDIMGVILYWFKGKEIESTENESTMEDEPSVYKFKEYFKAIEEEINGKKKIIIVFDNLDRLEKEKIKSLWSSIHTFFSDSKEDIKSWVIIPYNKEELLKHLSDEVGSNIGNGFIEKSIPINFRVTPPIVREWEKFFDIKLEEAFKSIKIDIEEKNILRKIFDHLIDSNTIKPRQIIKYINDIITLYLQWEDEIITGKIRLRHIGVFSLTRDKIIEDPINQILSREYLSKTKKLFDFDENLENIISALTFGVPLEIADEVLLYRNIKSILEGSEEKIEIYTNHPSFSTFFHKAYYDISIMEKVDFITQILNDLKNNGSVLSQIEIQEYWKNYSKEILTIEEQFKSFNNNHKEILLNNDKELMKKNILAKLINTLKTKISEENELSQEEYYKNLIEIEKFIKEKELTINIEKLLSPINFSVVPFLDLVNNFKNGYKKYKINCNEEKVLKYFEVMEGELDIDKINKRIDEIVIIKKEENFKFEKISSTIKTLLGSINIADKEKLVIYIFILKKINEASNNVKLSSTFYSNLSTAKLNEDEIYIDAFCIAVSNSDSSFQYPIFQNTLREMSNENINLVVNKIECYLSYDGLLKLLINNSTVNNYSCLKTIVYKLTKLKSLNSKLNLDWVLKNFSEIINQVFSSNTDYENDFLLKIESWNTYFKTPILDIDKRVFSHLNRQELLLIQKITVETIKHLNGLKKEFYFESFKDTNNINYVILESLINNNLINNFTDEFYSAYDDFIKGIAKGEIDIPNSKLWDKIIDILNGSKLKSYFTSLRDYFSEHDDMSDEEISFFEKGLFKYGNLAAKSDDISLKFILPMIKSNECFENIFLKHLDNIIPLIKQSQHKESIIGELQIHYNSTVYKTNEEMTRVTQEFKLNLGEDKNGTS